MGFGRQNISQLRTTHILEPGAPTIPQLASNDSVPMGPSSLMANVTFSHSYNSHHISLGTCIIPTFSTPKPTITTWSVAVAIRTWRQSFCTLPQ